MGDTYTKRSLEVNDNGAAMWSVVYAWANQYGYSTPPHERPYRSFTKQVSGSGPLGQEVTVAIEVEDARASLTAWTDNGFLLRAFTLFILPGAMAIELRGWRKRFLGFLQKVNPVSRQINDLFERLGLDPLDS